jgi:hypothetical protein
LSAARTCSLRLTVSSRLRMLSVAISKALHEPAGNDSNASTRPTCSRIAGRTRRTGKSHRRFFNSRYSVGNRLAPHKWQRVRHRKPEASLALSPFRPQRLPGCL